jgi:ADP-dependent NAD(P)H-hydrate dehydratase / NAD(P)H-hydrate epimerase
MTTHQLMSSQGHLICGAADVRLPTSLEAAAVDRDARERQDVPQRVLMESAGRAAALVLHALYPHGRVVGVAGPGNNGGDLAVLLRVLQRWGREVAMVAAGPHAPASALLHGDELLTLEGDSATAAIAGAGVLVDGMLGTGSTGPLREWAGVWSARLNAAPAPVVALDLPTGVDASTGSVEPQAVRAACTICFGWPKLGLLLQPARQQCGRIIAVEIGFPAAAADTVNAWALTPNWVRQRLPSRSPDAHKSSVGRLLIVAGHEGMAGAAAIAVRASLRAGAGLVRVASDASNRDILQTLVPETTFLNRDAVSAADVEGMHAVVAGPGLGVDDNARRALHHVLDLTPATRTLLDADALNILATEAGALQRIAASRPVIITPHAKELSRLVSVSVDDILTDMPGAVRHAASHFGCTVLLKGQPSLIAEANGALFVNTTGSSDVATAGMGDQLAGAIGAFLAAQEEPMVAGALGLYLSGRAADLCGLGRSLLPDDVSERMASAISDPGPVHSPLALPFVTFDQTPRR